MPPSADLLAGRRAVVFDAYGTLFDVHAAVARHAAAVGPDAARLSEIWRAKQLEYSWVLSLAGRYEPFWTLTERALDHAFARCPTVDRGFARSRCSTPIARSTPSRTPPRRSQACASAAFAPASSRTAARRCSRAPSDRRGLGPLLDAVLSVDAAGVFKTSPRTYALVTAALDCAPEEVVFVSSNRWDVAGAAAFGFQRGVGQPGRPAGRVCRAAARRGRRRPRGHPRPLRRRRGARAAPRPGTQSPTALCPFRNCEA